MREKITSNGANAAFRFVAISVLRFISFSTVEISVNMRPTIATIGLAINAVVNALTEPTAPVMFDAKAPVAPDRPLVFDSASCTLSA